MEAVEVGAEVDVEVEVEVEVDVEDEVDVVLTEPDKPTLQVMVKSG